MVMPTKALTDTYLRLTNIYNSVVRTGLPNALEVRIPLPSAPYKQANKLVLDGVLYGFSLQYTGPVCPTHVTANDYLSATAYPKQVREYIDKEIECSAVIGPFQKAPLEWVHILQLMTKSKTDSPDS